LRRRLRHFFLDFRKLWSLKENFKEEVDSKSF